MPLPPEYYQDMAFKIRKLGHGEQLDRYLSNGVPLDQAVEAILDIRQARSGMERNPGKPLSEIIRDAGWE